MRISREKSEELAKTYQFEISDEDFKSLEEDCEELTKGMELFEKINTDQVEPMVYPFDIETSFLRDGEIIEQLSLEEVVSNSPVIKNNYFVVSKVVD